MACRAVRDRRVPTDPALRGSGRVGGRRERPLRVSREKSDSAEFDALEPGQTYPTCTCWLTSVPPDQRCRGATAVDDGSNGGRSGQRIRRPHQPADIRGRRSPERPTGAIGKCCGEVECDMNEKSRCRSDPVQYRRGGQTDRCNENGSFPRSALPISAGGSERSRPLVGRPASEVRRAYRGTRFAGTCDRRIGRCGGPRRDHGAGRSNRTLWRMRSGPAWRGSENCSLADMTAASRRSWNSWIRFGRSVPSAPVPNDGTLPG